MSASDHSLPPSAPSISASAASCSDCQRLNGSLSCRARNNRSAWLRLETTLTGAENSRNSDGTGLLGTPLNSYVAVGPLRTSRSSRTSPLTDVQLIAEPFGPTSPKRTGMTNGDFSGCPAVGAVFWLSVKL